MLLECLINDLSPQRMQKISLIGYHNQQNYEIVKWADFNIIHFNNFKLPLL